MKRNDWQTLCWTSVELPRALIELLRAADLIKDAAELSSSLISDEPAWIEWAARHFGCEAEPLHTSLRDLEQELVGAEPSLLRIAESRYLAVLKANQRRVIVLTPRLERRCVPMAEVTELLYEQFDDGRREQFESLLRDAGLSNPAIEKSLLALLSEGAAQKRWNDGWVFRREPGGEPVLLLRDTRVWKNGAGLLTAHVLQYLLLIASWALLGRFSLAGRSDSGWRLAWVLLLLTMLPFQVFGTWLQGLFSIGLGVFLKRRLLCGALKLKPEEIRHAGAGTFLGQALEAEAVERLAVTGGLPGLLASVEIVLAMCVLGKLALLLAAVCAVAIYAAGRFLRRYQKWTDTRLALTNELVESMAGHRTRLAQQEPAAWHESEDQALHRYLLDSEKLDRAGAALVGAFPRCWLILALAGLMPSVVARAPSPQQMAVQLGGVLLAYTALRKWTGSFAGIAAACVAWKRIAPLFGAAARPEMRGEVSALCSTASSADKVLEAERLTFRYRPNAVPVVRECSLTVRRGDRILLEGSSGGGKTTFAALLAGIREPESGVLLVNGLDRHTLGSNLWRHAVAAAPQLHENHLFTETLAFNLLMGRNWPPAESDLDEAESVCRELGLGGLLDSMPSGLMQMVGEGGWQLSHGEKSRIFVARALLQNADLVILDESFAALDPENAKLALECTLQRANALIVIAHP